MKSVLRTFLHLALGAVLLQVTSAAVVAQQLECATTSSIDCGSAPSAVFDSAGRLWAAFVQDQHVHVSYSDDRGKSFSAAVVVNKIPEDAEHNGENRPKIVVDHIGTIYVTWTLKTSPRFTGEIRFSRSLDGGRSFTTPLTINDDGLFAGHRFESTFLNESGDLFVVWIDKRDLEAHLEADQEYSGAAVYYAVSKDQGATFSRNYRVADHSCECCRIAIASRGPENLAIMWRQIFGETTRDHAIATITPAGETLDRYRATYDEWQINACPHHGPSMIQSSISGSYHMSWFSNGDLHQGIYYSRFSFDAGVAEDVYQVDGNSGAGHPYLAQLDNTVFLIWKGFDGQNSNIHMITSSDDGRSWSQPETLLTTNMGSDHPLIVSHNNALYLSWMSDEHGYVFKQFASSEEELSDD